MHAGAPVAPRSASPHRAALAHRVGQRHQVVLVGMGGQRPGVAHEFPSARCGDAAGMADAQIPRMRFARRSEWAYHCRRVRVDERQRRHGIVRTPGPAAATGNVHDRKAIVRQTPPQAPDTRIRSGADVQPLPSARGRFAQLPAQRSVGGPIGCAPSRAAGPRYARSAAAADGAGMAQPGRAVRHGGAGGLRTHRAALARAGVRARRRGR